jgi:hypothetical protein
MNDSTPLSPADASAQENPSRPDLTNDGGPSLAASGDDEPTHRGQAEDRSTEPATTGRVGSLPPFHNAGACGIPAPSAALSPLEERLRRLEDALAQVADPKQIESRITQRVTERLTTERSVPMAQIAPAPLSSQGPHVNLPAGVFLDVGRRILTTTAGVARSAASPEQAESALSSGVRRTILFFDMLTEARAIWCMFTDPRYKMSWAGRLVPMALAVFLLMSAFLVPGAQIVVFGTIIDKIADLIPAFVLFKLLSYEARRYRETAPDLPPDLRL